MNILGKTDDGRDVKLNDKKRTRGLYTIGLPGTGKTTLLVNLALQDIENGNGLCYLDPHGDAIEDILRRMDPWRLDDVIYLCLDDAYPFGFNLFDCPDPTDDREVVLARELVILYAI